MSCNCREIRRYQHGKQTGGYIEKCEHCREKEAAAQALILIASDIHPNPDHLMAPDDDDDRIFDALARCKAAGWETEG